MSSKSSGSRVSKSAESAVGLKPTYIHDNRWGLFNITCGSVSGCLCLNKLEESKKYLGKCILANNIWYTPPEFEALGGKKPLGDYDLSCPQQVSISTDMSQGVCEAAVSEHNGCNSLSSVLLSSNMSSCTSTVARVPCPLLVDPVAFRLKGDNDSLKGIVRERLTPDAADGAKRLLWNSSKHKLEAMGLTFHARRNTDKRSQLAANYIAGF